MGGSQRFVVLALTLIAVWIGVYWFWPAPSSALDEPATTPMTMPIEPREDFTRDADPVVTPTPTFAGDFPFGETADERQFLSLSEISAADQAALDRALEGPPQQDPEGESSDGSVALVPPEFDDYIVMSGDDLWIISERMYGTRRHWQAIAKANPNVDPNRLRAGRTLRIPRDPDNIQGVLVDAETGEPVEAEKPAPEAEPEVLEYTVVRGDTLSGIAQMFYGRATRWRVIYDANRDVLRSPESMRAGMTLKIPPAPNPAGG